jgi:DME family drug/metabolite transporter
MRYRDTHSIRRVAILGAALAWGTMGFAKSFLPAETSPPAAGAVRLLGGAAILFLVCRRGHEVRTVIRDPNTRWWVLIGGVSMALSQALYFSAMTSAGVAIGAIATLGSVPVFGGLFTALAERRRPARRWAYSTALALGGGVALAWGGQSGHDFGVGVAQGVAAGLAYTIFTEACTRQIRHGGRPGVVMALTLGIAGVLLSPFLVLTSLTWLTTTWGIAIAGYLAAVTTAGTYVAYGWGLRTTSLDTVATLLLAEPAAATLLGIAVLHEPSTGWTWCGLALIGIALVALTRSGAKIESVPAAPVLRTSVGVGVGVDGGDPETDNGVLRRTVTVVITRQGDSFVARSLHPEMVRSGRSLAQSLEHLRKAVEHQLVRQPWVEAPHPLVTSLEVQVAGCRGRRPLGHDRHRRPGLALSSSVTAGTVGRSPRAHPR